MAKGSKHELKTWPVYFDAIARGEKTFEVRLNDRGFKSGDILVLMRFDPTGVDYFSVMRKRVGYILHGGAFGIKRGYVVMALEDCGGKGK